MAEHNDATPSKSTPRGCLTRFIVLLLLLVAVGLGVSIYFMSQPQDLSDIQGHSPANRPPLLQDINAMLRNSLERSYPVTLTEGDPSYLGGLVNAALSIVQPSDTGIVSGRSLLINTGAANVPAKVIGLHLRGNTSATAPAGFAAMSTGSKVILVSAAVGGAALLGVGAYAAVKKKTIGAVLKGMVRR